MDIGQKKHLVSLIKGHWNELNKLQISSPELVAGTIRTTLEAMVMLFWLEKYDKTPVFVINGKECFNLRMAIDSDKFSNYFNQIAINDMHLIRKSCNEILHVSTCNSNVKLSVEDTVEILKRLEKCIKAIQEKIDENIIPDSVQIATPTPILRQSKVSVITTNCMVLSEDEKAKEVFKSSGLVEGKTVYSSGIREFLCDYFEQSMENVKGQMSSRWVVPWYQKVIVWVVEMEKIKPNSQTDKWVNVYYGNEIIEIMPKGKTTFGHVHVRDYAKEHPYRIVVEKMKNKTMVVHGIYKFDEVKSVNDIEHYYIKI